MKRFKNCLLLLTIFCPLWLAKPALANCSAPANAIVAENCLPGVPQSTWDVSGAGDSTIQGFTTDISANVGQTVSFKINTTATSYRLDIYRLGYYGGNGARLVTSITPSAHLPQTQPACITDSATALMDCGNWAVSATWTIPTTAVSGLYIADVVRLDTGGDSHIPFVVRNDASTSPILFKTSDTTWQAYNDYGGANLYTGGPGPQGGAYKVSYNRPYHTRVYEFYSWIFNAEYPMIRFLEANGYDVSYFASLDADRFGSLILQHKTLLSVGHDEYWSGTERTNVEAARAAGIHLGFFSGNEVFWKIRWEPSIDGSSTANRTMVCYKETHANRVTDPLDPPTWTGTWRDARFSPPADGGRPENGLTGTIFMVNGPQSPALSIQVPAADGKMRLWRNTPVATQSAGAVATFPAGTLGYEWDEDLDNGFRPAGTFELSTATYDTGGNLLLDNGSTYGAGTATHHMTMYRASSGALVFGSGTVQWPWGLDGNHDGTATTSNTSMQQATINLFADMGVQPGSLQSGLVAGSGSTDTTPPSSTITSPASGGTVQSGSPVTITGTATDVGGVVGGVEVSTDGGITWHPAIGRGSWTYNWTPSGATGSINLESRAVDDSGNIETPSGGVTLTLAGRTCPCSIWNSPTPSTVDDGDASAVELGVKFRSDTNGYITGISFYKSAANAGTHLGHLWSDSGTLLASGTFTGESLSGWQKLVFSSPVAVTANTTYIASYFAPNGHYSADSQYFASTGVDNAPLHALQDGVDGGNGTYVYGTGNAVPSGTYQSTNYWVDVVFATSVGPDTTPPTVTSVSPAAGATLVAATTSVNAVFSEAVNTATVTGNTFQLFGPSNSLVAATVTYTSGSQTATLTPTAALAFSTTYTAVVTGGANGVKDLAGNAMTSNFSWSFTTAAAPPPPGTCPCTVWSPTTTPALLDSGDTSGVELGFRFRSDVVGTITSLRFYKSSTNTGTHTAHLWSNTGTLLATATFSGEGSSGWQQVDLGTPVQIAANTTYVASYFAPNGHYSANGNYFATAGVDNPPLHALANGVDGPDGVYHYGTTSAFPASTFQSSNYWVDVVFVPSTTTPPTVVSVSPASNSSGAGPSAPVTATFSEAMNPSTITGTTFLLVNASGASVAATVTYNSANTTATLTPTASLTTSTTYTATVKGGASGVKDTNGNLLAADFSWSFTTGTDTTPPTVTSVSPASGATLVAVTTGVNAVFSEGMNAATITGATFQLLGPSGSLVPATVSYNSASQAANLQPSAALAFSTTYTAVVTGGSNGVKDAANNPLTSNFSWSFTTATAPPPPGTCPCTVWIPTTLPSGVDSGDINSAELGFRFRSDLAGTITGVRFYKGTANMGTHIGHLWTNTGTLLASATFSGESSSGWQQVDFNPPVSIAASTTYVASYFAPGGHYSADSYFFANNGVDNAPLHALQDGVDGADGVYGYGATSVFPASTYLSENYWVDVVFVPAGSTAAPTVTAVNPASGSSGASLATPITATFSEPMTASSINATTVLVADASHNSVAGTVSYNAANGSAVFTPSTELNAQTTYSVTVKSGSSGVKDFNGNAMTSDFVWSFTTASLPGTTGPGGPILVISSLQNPFTQYFSEILNTEGLNEYSVTDISAVTSTVLSKYDVAILGDMPLTSSQVTMLSSWVNGGGNLIAMHPDKQLASLLGLTPTGSTLPNAYLQVQNASGPGVGIVGQTIQFHGTADQYTLSGATTVATLYSNATTPTTSPAVTLVSVGTGHAAAFTYDLARSIVYTRQGNPAWSGQARDGQTGPIRSDDLYFGAATFDPEPDWVDLNKVAIPQADEQQRLLNNLILQMNQNRKPLPRFWYLPSGFKAAIVMTGDDHGSYYGGGATVQRFSDFTAASPSGCSVPDWQCVRGTAYLFPPALATNTLTNAQAAAYVAQGFEIAVHVDSLPDTCTNWTQSELDADYTSLMSSFAAQYPSVPAPRTHRMHCIGWSDYDSQPQTELNHGIRLDTSYYYWPPTWVNNVPGLFTGSGMPMRFADRNGNIINVYQATTQMTDESGQTYPLNTDTLLDNAVGATGYYGAFVVQAHDDMSSYPGIAPAVVSSAQTHSVPIVTATQMLTWLDGRNSSSFGSLSWTGSSLNFTITVGTGARNLQAMLPTSSPAGSLSSISLGGSSVSFTAQTIKGVQYALFNAVAGSYVANYGTGSFTVSGTISGAGGSAATVTLTSGTTTVATTTASAGGAYSFSAPNGSYTVTPTKTGFMFTPSNQPVTVNGANVTVTAFSSAALTYTVSGTISGAGGNAATVTLTSGTTTVATTTASTVGAYSFATVTNGTYTVTPTKSGFTFSPTSQPVTVNGANVTVTGFTSAAQTYTVSGTISGAGGNAATVTLTSGATTVATTTASAAGAYSFTGVASGTYTVTPAKTGFTFLPASQPVTVNGANAIVSAFATQTYTVSGTISGAGGNAATITLTSGTTTVATTTASTAGAYSFSVTNGAYTVTPTKAGYTFTPTGQPVTVNGASVTVAAFTSTVIATSTLSTDAIAFKDNSTRATTITTSTFSTTSTNELLLAFVATDAPTTGTNTTVSAMTGAGLTWTLVKRTNAQRGTSEIWRAFAPATLTNVSVTATLSISEPASMTVVTFNGVDNNGTNGAGAVGATATGNAATGAPSASLVTTRNNSWVFGVGNDFSGATARTPGANQSLVHQLLVTGLDTFWVQKQNGTTPLTGTTVTINDTAPTNHRYNLTLVEVLPHL